MIFKELLVFTVLLSCEPKSPGSPAPDNTQAMDTVFQISMSHPTLTQVLDSTYRNPEQMKFVEVEITRVKNPKDYPMMFSVQYTPLRGESTWLGVFSLFPNDHPGTFIVATQGMLRSSGKIEVRLEPPEMYKQGDELSAELKKIRLKM
jgi:hypothetical protein